MMKQRMILPLGALACMLGALPSFSDAQVCGPAYRVQSQTVMVPQQETRYRIVYKTIEEEQEIVTQRPILRERQETQKYTVSVPVTETSTVEERYTVMRPVTTMQDRSYDETTYVTETAEREETYTTYRPVTETHYQTQSYVVQRPVTETQYQNQQYTTYRPVTTYQNTVVDQGQYVAQQYYQPGDTRYGLRWMSGGYSTNALGVGAYRRGGLGWVPYTSQGSTYAQLSYQPNPVQVAVPTTSMVPQVQQTQVPVQVTRMQNEVVQQQVPTNITRMEAVQQVRKVPYSIQKPVTRRVEHKVPVVQWVEQEMVRPKTVKRTSYKLETRERVVPIRYYETEAVRTKVKVPRRIAVREPYTITRMVPRTVQSPVTLSYYDPYAVPLSQGRSSWKPIIGTPTETILYGESRPAGSEPQQSLKKVDLGDPAPETDGSDPENVEAEESDPELSSSGGDDRSI